MPWLLSRSSLGVPSAPGVWQTLSGATGSWSLAPRGKGCRGTGIAGGLLLCGVSGRRL